VSDVDANGRATSLKEQLLAGLTDEQQRAVQSAVRRRLVIAGAGSGKTEVMSRRIGWRVGIDHAPRESLVAFTFTDRAAEEMKFRVRAQIERITPPGEDATLGRMYVGTIHGYCLTQLRALDPDGYHNYDILDEGSRLALVQKGFHFILGLSALQEALSQELLSAGNQFGASQTDTIALFLKGYDLLNEYGELHVALPGGRIPAHVEDEKDWCKKAEMVTELGDDPVSDAFALSAARFYAYLRCRRFLDFSTSQAEFVRLLERDDAALEALREQVDELVVDEVQDINPIQDRLIRLIVGTDRRLTAVGDHRQAIFAWRGGRVDIMGALYEELEADKDGEVIELAENFRSTPRIIDLANEWAATINLVKSMTSPDMLHGRKRRNDFDPTHVAARAFDEREHEADWIAETIRNLVRHDGTAATQDTNDGERGLALTDIAILIRSSSDARTYERALRDVGIPAIFRAGPDVFLQPEVLLFIAVLARMAGIDRFMGNPQRSDTFPGRVQTALSSSTEPEDMIRAACAVLRGEGLPVPHDVEERLLLASELVHRRHDGVPATQEERARLHCRSLADYVGRRGDLRRVFPQNLYQLALAEAEVGAWTRDSLRGQAALFQLGTLSSIVKGIETPGWTPPGDFRYQVIAMTNWGARNARSEEAPLLVGAEAVTISTIHAAKGLEYGAVFLADVCARRFPSIFARRVDRVPFTGEILKRVDPQQLADNANYDHERRLMYVALTRAERYLFVTRSGKQRSAFAKELWPLVDAVGGAVEDVTAPDNLSYRPSEARRDLRLVTSFSDLRYYLECPHDFYLRKVLGFAPTIDQAFGYGRGVHNLMRAIHAAAAEWANLALEPDELERRLNGLIESGLFYMRYTTGEPRENMVAKAKSIVSEYIRRYRDELSRLEFDPEREFETLVEEEQVLISGAIDVIRLDDPPRVTLLDFKSGEAESETSSKLDREEMRLQVSLYGLAARQELEYEPDRGLVRYLGEDDDSKRELEVTLDPAALDRARQTVVSTARDIRRRQFFTGPRRAPRDKSLTSRCGECDFIEFCGVDDAVTYRAQTSKFRPLRSS
jgi:DNA helicase II / ATP-dependent DNA helicase PcrA